MQSPQPVADCRVLFVSRVEEEIPMQIPFEDIGKDTQQQEQA